MLKDFETRYKVLERHEFSYGNYTLQPIRHEDMEQIRQWRNAQLSVLRQSTELSIEDQEAYFERVIKPSFSDGKTKILLLSFFKNMELIGYGGLVNICWRDKRAEMSFLLNPKRVEDNSLYRQDMTHFIYLIKTVVFDEMQFNRVFTETFSFRTFHISILENNGFVKEGTLREHIVESGQYFNSIMHGMLRGDLL